MLNQGEWMSLWPNEENSRVCHLLEERKVCLLSTLIGIISYQSFLGRQLSKDYLTRTHMCVCTTEPSYESIYVRTASSPEPEFI